MTTILEYLPDRFRNQVFLENGKLYIADTIKGDAALLSFISLAERRGISVNDIEWLEDRELRKFHKTDSQFKNEGAILAYARKLMQDAYDLSASDIHLVDTGPQLVIQLRRMNLVRDHATLPGEAGRKLLRAFYQTLSQDGKGEFSPYESRDARIVNKKYLPPQVYSVRLHTAPVEAIDSANGLGTYMALRLLYDSIRVEGAVMDRLKALGYSLKDAAKIRFLTQRTGMVLISGATGSGKSTVLKHVMEGQATEFPEKNYISHENPAEYPIHNVKQIHVQNDKSQQESNSGMLRCDPDVIMKGEIRDPEDADAVLDATLSGHAVWGTIHALDAFEIITRMRNLLIKTYPGDPLDTLCNPKVLAGLIYQRLIPTLCEHCKVPLQEHLKRPNPAERAHILPKDVLKRLISVVKDVSGVYLRGPGCEHCKNLGFAGRTLVVEVIVTDESLLKLVRNGHQEDAVKYWKESLGGRSYIDHAIECIGKGIADPAKTELELGAPLNIDKAIEFLNAVEE